jgi:hypothetical protein
VECAGRAQQRRRFGSASQDTLWLAGFADSHPPERRRALDRRRSLAAALQKATHSGPVASCQRSSEVGEACVSCSIALIAACFLPTRYETSNL